MCWMKVVLLSCFIQFSVCAQEIVIDQNCIDFLSIPDQYISTARDNLNIFYSHSSHGYQITEGGMYAIMNYNEAYGNKYRYSNSVDAENALYIHETTLNLTQDYPLFISSTEEYLDAHPECNVVLWNWCRIYNYHTYVIDTDQYIDDMEYLIAKYGVGGSVSRQNPVQFVFMTGNASADRAGENYDSVNEGSDDIINQQVIANNNVIREYCKDNNRILFDFYNLEAYMPDGTYFGDGQQVYVGDFRLNTDNSYWDFSQHLMRNAGNEWLTNHPTSIYTLLEPFCFDCAHSNGEPENAYIPHRSRLHCVLKGAAAWWLWARLVGWDGVLTTNKDAVSQSEEMLEISIEQDGLIQVRSKEEASLIHLINNVGECVYIEKIDKQKEFKVLLPNGVSGVFILSIVGENGVTYSRKVVII